MLQSVSFSTDLLSVLSQSLRRTLSYTLCLSLCLFDCLPMCGSRPYFALPIDADSFVPLPSNPAYFCLLLAYS